MCAYKAINNKQSRITDPLFGEYVDMIAKVVLPYQWDLLNDRVEGAPRSHCLENFRIAAGLKTGSYYGNVFLDTDAYKWLEAVAFCIESGKGEAFITLADELIDLIAQAQQDDGYLNTHWTIVNPSKRWSNLVEGHELYTAGHLFEAAVAYYNATQKRKILDIALRFADLICCTFGPLKKQLHGYPGHQEIEIGLIKLFRLTGEKKYLQTAEYFIRQRGKKPFYFKEEIAERNDEYIYPEFKNYDLSYSQSHVEPIKQRDVEGHAVRAMYMCAAMADIAQETGASDLEEACLALWESATERRMYITGGIGSSGLLERFTSDFDLDNEYMYCETCASVGLMMFGQRMASLIGNAEFYNAVERALFNTVLSGISADGKQYFYVNPLSVWPESCVSHTSKQHVKPVRQNWFDVACCPTNVARTLASLGQYIYAETNDFVCIHLFISSTLSSSLQGSPYTLSMSCDLVRKGTVSIEVQGSIFLKVRIPDYAHQPEFKINDAIVQPLLKNGYAFFKVETAALIHIDFHIAPRWIAANNQVRANTGKVALSVGPFVYCLEQVDNGENLASIMVRPNEAITESGSLKELPGDMPTFSFEGFKLDSGVSELYGKGQFSLKKNKITAVPYCLWCNRTTGEMAVWQKVLL